METPSGVKQAVIAILATLAISTLLALYQTLTGKASNGELIFALILYSLLCIIPYKISNKSNAARYVYLVITIASVVLLIAGVNYEKYILEYAISIILIPVEVFIIYRLFQREASNWFLSR